MREQRLSIIPNTEYFDGPSEVGGIIPWDVFAVFCVTTLFMVFLRFLFTAPFVGLAAGAGWWQFRKRFTKHFYLQLPFLAGFGSPHGVPHVEVFEFME